MNKELLISKVKELIAAQSCYPELKTVAENYLKSVGTADEEKNFRELLEGAKNCKSGIDECIGFLKTDFAKQIYGDALPEVLKSAENAKAKGEDTCICGACQACKAIIDMK